MEWSESLKPVDVLSQTFVVFFCRMYMTAL